MQRFDDKNRCFKYRFFVTNQKIVWTSRNVNARLTGEPCLFASP
jgi:hypothetical protein